MLGFSNLLKSNFGDSATALTSLLEPRLKNGQDAATTSPLPQSFDTPLGERRVPREKDPKKPNYDMIKDARKGILSGFLRSGKIFRASDFVGIVNPKTAIITVHDIYEFETRYLAAIDDQPVPRPPLSSMISFRNPADKGSDDEKTLRNLFFITLAHDELPSFHFWTKPGDLDPVTVGEPIDWGKHFEQNLSSLATTGKITMVENERRDKVQRGAEEQYNTHIKQPLGFLDDYNVNLSGMGREPSQAQPALEAKVLLQFNRGGMYLREFTHKALYAMACWLIENEEEDNEEQANKSSARMKPMFLDILEPGKDLREERIVSVSRASNRNFQDNIRPTFGQPDNKFRVRSTDYQSWWNFDSGGVGDLRYDLKLVRPNVGYCYCSAGLDTTENLEMNSLSFKKALEFLFDWESSAYPKSNRLSLDIPGHGFFDIDRNSDVVVDANILKIFHELSGPPVKPDAHPVEVFIRDVVVDATDDSDFLGTSSPMQGNTEYESGSGEVPDVFQAPSGVGPLAEQGNINASALPNQTPSNILDRLISSQDVGHGPIQATEIRGGPDFPSIYPRVLTNSEIHKLQERLKIAEASVVETDDLQEQLRTAKEKLSWLNGLQGRLKISEDRARLKSSCPFCPQDWAGVTKQQQQDHLKLHQKSIVHQPAPQKCPQPGCTSLLGENQRESTYEAISEHLRLHIEEEYPEDGICGYEHCHTNMYTLTAEQQEEHESFHHDNKATREERDRLQQQVWGLEKTLKSSDRLQKKAGNLEDILKERDHLQAQVRNLEHTAADHDQLEQQVKHLQDVANERDQLQESLVVVTDERNLLRDWAAELERRLWVEGMQTEETEPETELDEEPRQPSQPEAPNKLRYCNVCLKSVDKLSANAKIKHADRCETSVSKNLVMTPPKAKAEREKRDQSHDVVRPQAHGGTEEVVEASNPGKMRGQKALAKAAPAKSKQDEAEVANTVRGPEASKAKGHKTPKRKLDTFKPSGEDELEDLESPKKKPKPKAKAKAAKADEEVTANPRRSTRGKDVYVPPEEEEDEEEDGEEASDELLSSAKGGKRKKRVAAVTTVSKKAKAKK